MNNDKLKDTRPFDIEHAKAGAPYACRNGTEATIVKFDGRAPDYPLVGYFGQEDLPVAWAPDGRMHKISSDYDLVMTPLGYIDGKPVFVGDKVLDAFGVERTVKNPGADFTACRWPAPAKVYPETGMSATALCQAFAPYEGFGLKGLRDFANTALRHAIDNAQVIPLDQHVRECGEAHVQGIKAAQTDRAARDMAIAEAVRDAIVHALRRVQVETNSSTAAVHLDASIKEVNFVTRDLAAIIAKVPA